MEENKRKKKSFSKERKKVKEEVATRAEEEEEVNVKKDKKRKSKAKDDVHTESEEITYKKKRNKREKNGRVSEILTNKISDESLNIEVEEKTKKRKSKKENNSIEEQETENNNGKKKGKENPFDSDTGIEKTKKQKSKKFKSKEDNILCFDTEEGLKNITVDKNGELADDMAEKIKAKEEEKSKKAKRNEDESLSKNDETLVEDETAVKKKKKETKKKDEKKSAETENTDAPDKKNSGDEALLYLRMWNEDRPNWAFKKVRQVWLLKHMFDKSKIPDSDFEVLLLYLEGLQGNARKTTITRAEAVLESGDDEEKPEGFDLERVRKLLQILN